MKGLEDANVTSRQVLVRLPLDVPLSGGREPLVLDDSRLRGALATLRYLLERDASVVMMGKLGRPAGHPVSELSLRPVYTHLSALLKRPIRFAPTIVGAATTAAVQSLKPGELLGLENLEFEGGELKNSRTFARQLAKYGELYVDDDFPKSHHGVASMVAITEFLPSYAGLTLEKEYRLLTNLLRHPAQPFVVVIGGAKADKLPVIKHLLHRANRILVGGGVANIFLAAAGRDVGTSTVDQAFLPEAQRILKESAGRLILPLDDRRDSSGAILDIGPKTIQEFERWLGSAKTIFWNGNLGKSEEPEFRAGSDAIATAIANSGATTVAGGGNTQEIIERLGLTGQYSFVSSGGGATLAVLAGEKLPAVEALR